AGSPVKPKLNTARRYTNVVVSGTDTTAAKRTLSTRTGSPGSRIRNLIVATVNRYPATAISPQRCRRRNSQAIASGGERTSYASGAGAASLPTWVTKISSRDGT